jgi:hypothetical protein
VGVLCNELSGLIRSEPDVVAESVQSQSQGGHGDTRRGSSSVLATVRPDQTNWWPVDLGVPSSLGTQSEVRYAYFPVTRCLAIAYQRDSDGLRHAGPSD